MPIIDDVLGFFSPTAKLNRMRARRALEIMSKRGYDGARMGRRTSGWITPSTSANAEIAPSLAKLRDRSRDLVRNNPYAAKALRVLVSNSIGTGIVPSLKSKSLNQLWEVWTDECDIENQLDFYGMQRLAGRAVFESGECIVRFIVTNDDSSVPLKLQVLEPDYLDSSKSEVLRGGGYIQHGIEYNSTGQRVAYWLHKEHPGDRAPIMKGFDSFRVPASDILHIYEKLRPGQSRGVPIFAPSMITQNDLDEYEEATLVRKASEACITAFVESDDDGSALGTVSTESGTNRKIEELAPGTIEYLGLGERVTFNNPPASTGYADYVNTRLHAIAAGIGITYEQMTGDLSQVNYSSIRAGTLDFRREVEQFQWLTFIPMFCRQVMKKWLQVASVSNGSRRDIQVFWTTPKWDWVDPVKDVQGEENELRLNLKSWSKTVRERGLNPDELINEIKKDREAFEQAGIKYPLGNEQETEPEPETENTATT
jgi:lambda family phage portal protein